MSVLQALGSAVIVVGVVLSVLAALGVLDFPSVMSRMHAATKSASLGLALIALGSGIAAESAALTGVAILVAVFLFITAPISGHMLGRAAYFAGQVGGLAHDDLASRTSPPLQVARPELRRFSVLRWVGLVLTWVLLWRDIGIGTIAGGALVAGSIEAIRRVNYRQRTVSPIGLTRFLIRYLGMVVASNIRVAWEVITPSNEQIREAIVAVPLTTNSVPAALLVANAISYTPGSLTVELTEEPLVLYVHVLHFISTEAVRADVARMERLAERALPAPVPV